VGTQSWAANIRDGFEWDNDCFMVNHLAHPYHGAFYHSSARGSGYGFWGTLPYVVAGSASWELFFENVRPSLNDFVNTTLGGIALGEVTFRLSSLVAPHRSSSGGAFREAGAFALSPIARVQAALDGSDRMPEPRPPTHQAWIAVGSLRDRIDASSESGNRGFVELAVRYGSPFDEGATRPFDAFELRLQLSRAPTEVVNRLAISGLLARDDLRRWRTSQLSMGLFQHYDYQDSSPYEFAGQSLSGALLYRRTLGSRLHLDLGAHAETLVLGAITSDHGHYFRRDYDYGPGLGARFSGSLRRGTSDLLHFEHRTLWLHSVYGAEANHRITETRFGLALPITGLVQVGGDLGLRTRQSAYRGLPSHTRRASQLRTYLVLSR
jgi:hypothetical protein